MPRPILTDRYQTEKTEQAWAEEALARACEYMGRIGSNSRHRSLYAAAASVGPYIEAGHLDQEVVLARLLAAASVVGMDGKRGKEARRTALDALRKGAGNKPWYPAPVLGSAPGRMVAYAGRHYRVPHSQRPVQVVSGWASTLPAVEADLLAVWAVFYGHRRVTQGRGELLDLDQVQAALESPEPWPKDGKDALPLWHFVRIEGNSRARRRDVIGMDGQQTYRDAVVEAVDALVLDYDEEPAFSLEWVHERFQGVTYFAHTSASHQVTKGELRAYGRGRVILPLSRPVSEEEYAALVEYLLQWPGLGKAAPAELRSVRRAYFVPVEGPGGYAYRVHRVGTALDPDAMLAKVAEVNAAPVVEGRVWDQLDTFQGAKGTQPRATLRNLRTILVEDPEFAGRARRNDFAGVLEWDGVALADATMTQIRMAVHAAYGLEPKVDVLYQVLEVVAMEAAHHPVREYLRGLRWDGEERLDTWLPRVTGSDGPMTGTYGRKFLLSMVARVLRPGCKVDTVLILVGDQGARKSTLMATLGGAWFRDTPLAIGEKDAFIALRDVWLYELAELDSVSRRDWSAVKAFISSQSDEFRPPYGRNSVKQPRQVIFAGTTNDATFLSDSTGSRRFWPVRVAGAADVDELERLRDQLFAEAVQAVEAGEAWWLTAEEEEARAELSMEYQSEDPWTDAVDHFLVGRVACDVAEVIASLGKRLEDATAADEKRIVRILAALGWRKSRRVQVNGSRRYKWEPARRG